MTDIEFRVRLRYLESERDRNQRIKCLRVAARIQREIDELKKNYLECHD